MVEEENALCPVDKEQVALGIILHLGVRMPEEPLVFLLQGRHGAHTPLTIL